MSFILTVAQLHKRARSVLTKTNESKGAFQISKDSRPNKGDEMRCIYHKLRHKNLVTALTTEKTIISKGYYMFVERVWRHRTHPSSAVCFVWFDVLALARAGTAGTVFQFLHEHHYWHAQGRFYNFKGPCASKR